MGMTRTSMNMRLALPAALLLAAGCQSGPRYERQVGEFGERQPAASISFEARDYGDLARLFAGELEEAELYRRVLCSKPGEDRPPAIAHKEFTVDISDLNTKPAIIEESIRVELQRIGVRYIAEDRRAAMIASLELQNSDLNDPSTRGQFGKFANAKYYLVGKIYENQHYINETSKKREFFLVVDLVELETLESVFTSRVFVIKYMTG